MIFDKLEILLAKSTDFTFPIHLFYGFCLFLTLPLSFFTAYVIVYKTPKYMGNYRFLILAQLISSLVFSVLVFLSQPVILLPYTLLIATGPLKSIGTSYLSWVISLTGVSVINMGLLSTTSAAFLVYHVDKMCGKTEARPHSYFKYVLILLHALPTITLVFAIQMPIVDGEIDVFFEEIRQSVSSFKNFEKQYSFYGVHSNSMVKWILGVGMAILFPLTIGFGLYFIQRSKIAFNRLIILKRNTYTSLRTFQHIVFFFLFTPFVLLGIPCLYILISCFPLQHFPIDSHLNSLVICPTVLFPIIFSTSHLLWIAPYKRYLQQTIRSIRMLKS